MRPLVSISQRSPVPELQLRFTFGLGVKLLIGGINVKLHEVAHYGRYYRYYNLDRPYWWYDKVKNIAITIEEVKKHFEIINFFVEFHN